MTLAEIKALVIACDPNAGHYESAYAGSDAYTVWRELHRLDLMADDLHQSGWAFQIDRFTRSEDDAIAQAFVAALDAEPAVAYSHLTDYERDSGYIHHIFDCEGD